MQKVKNKEEVLQCRSCNEVFNQKELRTVQVERYGRLKEEKACPYCGNYTYGRLDYPISEEKLQFNKVNYPKYNKHSRRDEYIENYLEQYQEEINRLLI